MLLIKTYVAPSLIHGNGVFAGEAVPAGAMLWQYEPAFDRIIADEELVNLPAAFSEYIDMYAYRSKDIGGRLLLSCDHAKFQNHSDDPNTEELLFKSIARRPINIGDEITCDYGAFCTDFTGFE